MLYFWALLLTATLAALRIYSQKPTATPDGKRYAAMADGRKLCRPFSYRWLVPWLVGLFGERIWRPLTIASVVLAGPTMAWYCHGWGLDDGRALLAVALLCGLPGVFHLGLKYPWLVDQPAFLLSALSAAAAVNGQPWISAVVALGAGMTREVSPLFAAAASLSPWPLVGLVAPAVRALLSRGGADVLEDEHNRVVMAHPLRAARVFRQAQPGGVYSLRDSIAPWGVVLPAALTASPLLSSGSAVLVWAAAGSLLLGYAQVLIATDNARLYQQAALPVVGLAAICLPWWLVPVAVVAHLCNPWAHGVEV